MIKKLVAWLKKTVYFLIAAAACVILFSYGVTFLADHYAASVVMNALDVQELQIPVQKVGLSRVSVGPLTLGDKETTHEIRIENLSVEYHLWQVCKAYFAGKPIPIERVYCSGVRMDCLISREGEFSLKTSQWKYIRAFINKMMQAPVNDSDPNDKPLPFMLKRLIVRNSQVEVEFLHQRYAMKIDGVITADQTHSIFDKPTAGFQLQSESHTMTVKILPDSTLATVDVQSDLSRLPLHFLPDSAHVRLTGLLNLQAKMTLPGQGDFKGAEPKISLSGSVRRFSVDYIQGGKRLFLAANRRREVVRFRAQFERDMLNFAVDSLRVAEPTDLALNVGGALNVKTLDFQGELFGALSLPSLLSSHPGNTVNFSFCPVFCGGQLLMPGQCRFPETVSISGVTLHTPEKMELCLKGDPALQTYALTAETSPWNVQMNEAADACFQALKLNAAADLKTSKIVADCGIENGVVTVNSLMQSAVDSVQLTGSYGLGDGVFEGCIKAFVPSVTAPETRLTTLDFSLPFVYGSDSMPDAGYLTVDTICVLGVYEAAADFTIRQDAPKLLSARGRITPEKIPLYLELDAQGGYRTDTQLNLELFGLRADVQIPQTQQDSFSLGVVSSDLENYTVSGSIGARVHYSLGYEHDWPYAQLDLSQVCLQDTVQGFAIENLGAVIRFEQGLGAWRFPYGQHVYFDTLRYNKIVLNHADVLWRMDENQAWRLDALSVNWAGGMIRSLANKLDVKTGDYDILLHCSDLLLREILTQFCPEEVARMHGDVRVNGLVPLQIKHNRLYLNKGYLYTAPGETGSIEIDTGDAIAKNKLNDGDIASETDLSCQALKAFNYNWIKLGVGMKKDDAPLSGNAYKLSLNVFGEPAVPLPFKYDTQRKAFVYSSQSTPRTVKLNQQMNVTLNISAEPELLETALNAFGLFEKLKSDFFKNLFNAKE